MKNFRVFLFLVLFPFLGEAKVLISTVAQVKSHVITTREVEIHNLLMAELQGEINKFKVEQSLEQIVREWLLFFEASTFYASKLSGSEVDQAFAKAKKSLDQSSKWQKLSVSSAELRKKLKRHLEARRLFTFKKKASVLPVSKAEIETEYTQNRIRYGNMTLDEAREKIRINKINENLRSRLEQWFQVLEKKYKVQRFTRVS